MQEPSSAALIGIAIAFLAALIAPAPMMTEPCTRMELPKIPRSSFFSQTCLTFDALADLTYNILRCAIWYLWMANCYFAHVSRD